MNKNDEYLIVVVPLPEEDGPGFMAYVPDLKGCMSHGDTQAEAIESVSEAIRDWIDAATAAGREIPKPNSALKKAMEERNLVLKKIHEQSAIIAGFTKQIEEMKAKVTALSARITADQSNDPWPSALLATVAKARKKTKSAQEVH